MWRDRVAIKCITSYIQIEYIFIEQNNKSPLKAILHNCLEIWIIGFNELTQDTQGRFSWGHTEFSQSIHISFFFRNIFELIKKFKKFECRNVHRRIVKHKQNFLTYVSVTRTLFDILNFLLYRRWIRTFVVECMNEIILRFTKY